MKEEEKERERVTGGYKFMHILSFHNMSKIIISDSINLAFPSTKPQPFQGYGHGFSLLNYKVG